MSNDGCDLEDIYMGLILRLSTPLYMIELAGPRTRLSGLSRTKQGGLRNKQGCSLVKAAHQAIPGARTER